MKMLYLEPYKLGFVGGGGGGGGGIRLSGGETQGSTCSLIVHKTSTINTKKEYVHKIHITLLMGSLV